MRKIKKIVIHCSATEEGVDYTVEDITAWHKARGFRTIGYHFLVHPGGRIDGARDGMRGIQEAGAHAKGYNMQSIGICYVGGLKDGDPEDTRTVAQKYALQVLVKSLASIFPELEDVCGHRDLSVDLNGDGVISPSEWMKACPCFNVRDEFKL